MNRLVLSVLLLLGIVLLALMIGPREIVLSDLMQAMNDYDPYDPEQVTIMQIRLPRLFAGLIAGGALGIAAMVMQAVTRNPLADPGLLGVNAGAVFFLILGATLLGQTSAGSVAIFALVGAFVSTLAVFALGGGLRRDVNPIRLVLAGVAINGLLLSLVAAVALVRQDSLELLRFWVAGSLSEATLKPLAEMAILAFAGTLLAWVAAPRFEALALGADLAQGLGESPRRVLTLALLGITMLTGAAVSVAGPIAFLGLMVPPLVRLLQPNNLRQGLFFAAIIGASVLLLADVLGRMVLAPGEVRAGVMTALLGAPAFLWAARRVRPGASV